AALRGGVDGPPQLPRAHDGVEPAGGGRPQDSTETIEKRRSTKTLHRNVTQIRNTKGVGTLPLRLRATMSCYVFGLRLLAFPPVAFHERRRIAVLRILPGVEQLLDPARPAVVRQQGQPQLRVGVPFV